MLVTPSLLHVKTRTGRSQQEDAVLLRLQGGTSVDMLDGLTAEQVLARVDVPVMRIGPEKTEWQCVRDDHAAMAAAGEWPDLLEALRYTDQERVMASGGRRVAPLISEGMRSGLTGALSRADWTAAKAELTLLEDVFDTNPEDYCAAQVLAQAHIDMANATRSPTAAQLSRDAWSEAAAHFAAAEDLLTLFDPIEEMSPLLAGTRYALVPGIEDGGSVCREWYEDWVDLDPEDAAAHATHAVNMLPGWYGSLAAFEREARRAVRLTEGLTGKAAYAVFHISAAETLGDLSPTLDHELFFEALGRLPVRHWLPGPRQRRGPSSGGNGDGLPQGRPDGRLAPDQDPRCFVGRVVEPPAGNPARLLGHRQPDTRLRHGRGLRPCAEAQRPHCPSRRWPRDPGAPAPDRPLALTVLAA
jgi:hypothetical protein